MAQNQNDQEGKAPTPPAETELRFDRMDHFVMRNEGNARLRCACMVVEVCIFAKNTIEVFAQSVLSTTTRSTERKS